MWIVTATGTRASRHAYSTDGLSSGNVLWMCTTSGRNRRSTMPRSRLVAGFQITRAGSVAFCHGVQSSMSSQPFEVLDLVAEPGQRGALLVDDPVLPLGAVERYLLCAMRTS